MANKGGNTQKYLPKVITTSTSIGHVLISLVMLVCRKITTKFVIKQRLLVYLSIIFFGGIVNDFAPVLIRSILFRVDKKNILNQWGVKIGWFWTCALLAPFMLLTSIVVNFNNQHHNLSPKEKRQSDMIINRIKHQNDKYAYLELAVIGLKTIDFFRLILNTITWYLSVNFYNYVESMTSSCVDNTKGLILTDVASKDHCIRAGHRFISGFDISGHTFLLLFANLLILSECKIMIGWENLESILQINPIEGSNQIQTKNMSAKGDFSLPTKARPNENKRSSNNQEMSQPNSHNQNALYLYKKFTTPIRITYIFLTILCVLWDFMIIQTALFYHTMIQKLIAALWATAVWYILYHHVYRYVSRCPLPAKELLDRHKKSIL